MFACVLNRRLISRTSSNCVVIDAQFGFQPIRYMYFISEFCTKCLVSETLQTNERFYFCFIDYKKAFNAVNREKLYMKLKYFVIQGQFLTVILSMYSRIIIVC